MKIDGNRTAGILIAAGMTQFMLLMLLSEVLYPHYSVATNYISDLGVGSTAMIFNGSIMLLGILLVAAAIISRKTLKSPSMSALIAIVGIAAFCVGTFPETTGLPHYTSAGFAFVGGAVAAINSVRVLKGSIRPLVCILGIISLAAFFTAVLLHTNLGLGNGGMERFIAYPVFIWSLVFGAYLLGFGGKARK